MSQLVHDVAPGAAIRFHTAFNSEFDFAEGIIELADAGADVIVDDVGYFAEPFFSDGMIAQAVDIVTGRGVAYFMSAGNQARDSYESAYRPLNVLARKGAPPVAELGKLGVARISVGGALAFTAVGGWVNAARELREQGTYAYFEQMAEGVKAVRAAFG